MHYGGVVVWYSGCIGIPPGLLHEIANELRTDVVNFDVHIFISVRPALLVVESNRVANLMSGDSKL